MNAPIRWTLLLALVVALIGCASSEQSKQAESDEFSSPNRLVVGELSAPTGGLTAYDLVNQYKTTWLWKPETTSLQNDPQIQVYINNVGDNAGSISALRRISADNISVIEYFPPTEAQFRFGLGNSVGAILVHLNHGS